MYRRNGLLVLVLGFWLAATPAAWGDLLTSTAGLSGLGTFSGTIDYQASSNTSATLTIAVENTTPAALGGDLTAFVFNNPNNLIATASLSSAPAHFALLASPHGINASPYGQFDFGASTGNAFQGGGSPSLGLAPGVTGTFVFALTGSNLQSLTTSSFFSTLSVGPGNGQGDQAFVARFRGFIPSGSDKVPGADTSPPSGPGPHPAGGEFPEPGSLVLAMLGGSGLVLLAWNRKRRKRLSITADH
jgi:hypothetical protein